MTYEEAVEMCPHDEVFVQVDDVVRLMTPEEYEKYIQELINYVPSIR
jgi:hypothetical protein